MGSFRGRLGRSGGATILMVAANTTVAMLMQHSRASAQVIFSENFDSIASNSTTAPASGYANFAQVPGSANTGNLQIQGGGGGAGVSIVAGVDSNGVGDSQALFTTMDASQASGYAFLQIQGFNLGAAPTNATEPSQVQISFDMSVEGANPSTPDGATSTLWSFDFVQGALGSATYSSTYSPTLAVNGSYTHVVYTLDEGTQSGTYSPSAVFSMQASAENGANDGYNFAAGDTFHLDNFEIQTITGAPGNATWSVNGSGDWNNSANWSSGSIPNGVDSVAEFLGAIATNQVVYTTNPITLGTLVFNNSAASYALTGAVGTNLTLQTSIGSALVDDQNGTQEINIPLVIASNTTFQTDTSTASLVIANPITINSGVTLTTTGSGTVVYQSTINVGSSASISFASSTNANALNLASNATATVSAPLLEITSLSNLGTLNVQNNEVLINYGNGTDPIASIQSELASGFNNGHWDGPGIISTNAQTLTNGLRYGLGWADGADHVVSGLSSGEIEIKYTLLGDANLDGVVNGSDFSILAANFGTGHTNWDQGDFLYTSAVNGSDFSALANNFGQGASGVGVSQADIAALDAFAAANGLSAPSFASVPEPASLGLLMLGTAVGACRRRRSHG